MKKILALLLILIYQSVQTNTSTLYMVSISSDGRYILTSHEGGSLVLWDVQNKKKRILNHRSNVWSPYFIPNTHQFLWQEVKTNKVYLQTVNGKILKSISPKFRVYGHVASHNLEDYIASDSDWSLFRKVRGKFTKIKPDRLGNLLEGKLFNLSFAYPYVLGTGVSSYKGDDYPIALGLTDKIVFPSKSTDKCFSLLQGVAMWDIRTGKAVAKYLGSVSKTVGSLSPDGKYIIAGDENIFLNVWETKTGKKITSADIPLMNSEDCVYSQNCRRALEKGELAPDDLYVNDGSDATISVKFINTKGYYLRFLKYTNYAILYYVNSPKILAYMKLGSNPRPHTLDLFHGNDIIDTAPKAGILVMGQEREGDNNGIIVYRFNEKTHALDRIWAPKGPGARLGVADGVKRFLSKLMA